MSTAPGFMGERRQRWMRSWPWEWPGVWRFTSSRKAGLFTTIPVRGFERVVGVVDRTDVVFLLALGMIVVGVALVFVPAGLITAGVLLAAFVSLIVGGDESPS